MILPARPSSRLLIFIAFSILTIYGISTLVSFKVAVHHPKLNPFRPVEKAHQQPLASYPQPLKPNSQQEKLKDLQILWSKRNPRGLFNLIDDDHIEPQFYNPTFLELPLGSPHHFMVFGRLRHVFLTIDNQDYRKSQLVAFFANMTQDGLGNPVMRRFDSWNETFLDDIYEPALKRGCDIHNYLGPEDVKVWWTTQGAPMLMFTNIYPIGPRNECFSMFMIDARAAVPKLVKALGDYAEYLPPIEIAKPVRLHREHPQKVEKNWAPFQAPVGPASGDIYFSVDLDGQRVYKYNEDEDFVVPLSSPESDQEAEEEQPPQKTTCMHKVTDKYHYWQVHQGTPILSMTLCNRGECEPNIHNTVNFGIIQPKYIKPLNWYEPRVVTWNITQPFEWRSISKRLTYHGTKTREYIYTMHMGYYFNRAAPPVNKAHGYLDDEIWLGFGIADSKGAFIDVDARELMRDHYYCENATLDYRIES